MTVSSTTSKAIYSGNGLTTTFAVPFYFLAAADLEVILRSGTTETVQALTTNYTVSGAGSEAGGTVTMLVAPASGATLTIRRSIAATQGTDLLPNDRLPAEDLEDGLDKLTMIAQQLGEESGRSIKFPASDAAASATLPVASARASKFLTFDSNGLPVATVGVDATTDIFTQTGTGATPRSVNDKLRDTVSAKDFGVVGDGATDDVAAMQVAISAAANKTLLIPSGMVVYLASPITVSNPVTITMDSGASFKSGYTSPSPDNALINVTASDVTLNNVTIDGQSKDHAAIKATSVNRLKVNGGYIYDFGQRSAIWLQACNFCDITGVRIGPNIFSNGSGNLGAVYANQCTEILARELRITGYRGKGVSIRLSERCSVTDCFINGNPTSFGDGIYLGYDSAYITISGCHIRNCGGNGIKISRGAKRSTVVGCTIDGTTEGGSGIMLQGAVECTVTGCKIALTDATSATRAMIIQPHEEDAPGEGSDCSDNVISGNTIISFSTTVPAILMDDNAVGFTTYRNRIADNSVLGGQIGIAAYTSRTQISGNTIRDSAAAGISVRYVASFSDVVNNDVFGNAVDNAIYVDLDAGGQAVKISNNRLTGCAYGGIYLANVVRSQINENVVIGTGAAAVGINIASTANDLNVTDNYIHNFGTTGIYAPNGSATGLNISGNQLESCTTNAIDVSATTGRIIGNIAKSSGAFAIANKAGLIHYGNADKRLYVTTPDGTSQYAISVDNAGAVTTTSV